MRGEQDVLLEAAVTAHRERDPSGRIQPSPAWMDLSPEQREELFDLQSESRILERALSRRNVDSTIRAVLFRVAGSLLDD